MQQGKAQGRSIVDIPVCLFPAGALLPTQPLQGWELLVISGVQHPGHPI